MLTTRLSKKLQVDRADDVLVRVQHIADIVRVVDDIEGEYQGSNTRVDNLRNTNPCQ